MLIHYKIKFYDDNERKVETDSGITSGKTIGEGVDRAVKWYGEKNIIGIEVYGCESVLDTYALEEMIKEDKGVYNYAGS